jgi:hypothetical protein
VVGEAVGDVVGEIVGDDVGLRFEYSDEKSSFINPSTFIQNVCNAVVIKTE